MLHTYQLIMLLVFLVIFCCVQLFLVFKCIGISSNQKKVFWLLITYTIVFKTVESYLELLPEFNASLALQTTHSLVHAINTFILLTIIGGLYGWLLPAEFCDHQLLLRLFDISAVHTGSYCHKSAGRSVPASRSRRIFRIPGRLHDLAGILVFCFSHDRGSLLRIRQEAALAL